jgi:hypothetical protein
MTKVNTTTVYNKTYIPLSQYKNTLMMFRDWNLSPMEYYADILFKNNERWHFVNPMTCRESFKTAYNMLKFIVLKRLIRVGYRLRPYKCKDNNWYYTLELR